MCDVPFLLNVIELGGKLMGPLTGSPKCRMSNLRNGYVNCHHFYNFNVVFKMVACRI